MVANTPSFEDPGWRSLSGAHALAQLVPRAATPDPSTFRIDVRACSVDGVEVSGWRMSPLKGEALPDRSSTRRLRIDILTAGSVEYSLHGKVYTGDPGSAHLLPCWTVMPFTLPSPAEVLRLVVPPHLTPAALLSACSAAHGPLPRTPLIAGLAALTEEVLLERRWHPSSSAARLLKELCSAALADVAGPELELRQQMQIYIETHLSDPNLSPSEIAAVFGISLRWAHRVFDQDSLSIAKFIRIRRCEEVARQALEPGPRTSTRDLALRSGFTGPDQMARAFKAHYGMTIQRYRAGRD